MENLNVLQLLLLKLSVLLIAQANYQALPVSMISPTSTLYRIAACESMGEVNAVPRQFNSDGSILWGNDPKTGKPIKRDVGEFQINLFAHGDEVKRLGLDVIHSQGDNETYALILYNRNGLSDWKASRGCWK